MPDTVRQWVTWYRTFEQAREITLAWGEVLFFQRSRAS